jgi:molecular chaperone GrpE
MKNETEQPDSTEFPAAEDASNAENNQAMDEVLGELDAMETEPSGDETTAILLDKLRVAEAEVLRSRAEMENYRKRMQRDADQQLKFANVPIVRDLLDVIDNLNRAIEAARGDETNTKALIDGVQMVSQQFNDALAKHACKPIQAVGTAFDPNIHQAIAQMPSQDVPAGTVAMEVAVGYMLHDRVIRPAQVIVSTGSGS